MFREFDYIELGASMYTPATNKNLIAIAEGLKFPHLRSVVFCLEDAIKDEEIESALKNVALFLEKYKRENIKVFLRPKNIENLQQIIELLGIEKIDGFALAKFGIHNMEGYFKILSCLKQKYHIMPVIESSDMFENEKLCQIKDFLLTQKQHHIVTLRIGGEDMFQMVGIKKGCEDSIHDFHISSKILGDLLSVFKPYGFNIAAPVYNCLENKEFFVKEVQRDIKEGFFGKTIIHPDQSAITNECYKVTKEELDEAKEILKSTNDAIFRFQNRMCEPKAHGVWATNIVRRAKVYGLRIS
jgi:citrate lyase beta subunit